MTRTDKREEILHAALELIAENGFHGAPMAMIAERAGVGAGTIYRYFENKDVLINVLYQELESRIRPVLMVGYATDKPIRERFIHLGSAWLKYFIDHPLDFRYLEQFHNSPYGVEFRRDKLLGKKGNCGVYQQLFAEAIAQQVMKDLPLASLFALAFGPLLAVARDHILGFIALDEDLIARITAACWDGVRR
ncbi:TetR family transcriptional regulator [Desulfuromonas sp. DDH964]|uniref:TetR/AcrR family transcriptional regulator n=1 Tax=Desulfuromonas sp. DDH964 TaxID=1823759 RepID=UPI00078E4D1A|nr:TetR/AcrR family transcriptional regulator [Desulfuromonas sp. DDH964]AMV73732.1 TetR family transcriptional regulator [Desulfuromonas sp. DDH964]